MSRGHLDCEILPYVSKTPPFEDLLDLIDDKKGLSIKIECASSPGFLDQDSLRTSNDTTTAIYSIDSVFAYDDGSAELAAGISTVGDLAYKFTLPEGVTDTLTGIMINFPKTFSNATSGLNSIDLKVWSSDSSNAPGKAISSIGATAMKASVVNEFAYYELPKLAVSSTFFIGYHQEANGFLGVGLDRNGKNQGLKAWFKLISNESWQQDSSFVGTLMIRPVFSRNGQGLLLNNKKNLSPLQEQLTIYPHPNTSNIFNTNIKFDKADLLRPEGGFIKTIPNKNNLLDCSGVKPGVYLLRIYYGSNVVTKKIIIL